MRVERWAGDGERMVGSRRSRAAGAWTLAAAAAAFGCSDAPGPTVQRSEPAVPAPFVASVASRGPLGPMALVYVSLPPGALAAVTAGEATLRVVRTGSTAYTHVVEGGFDPVALTAVEGDSIAITVQLADVSTAFSYGFLVPKPTRPVIVRTNPPKDKRDVPLNARMTIVFSEPVDPTSLSATTVVLRRVGGAAVAGRVEFADAARTAAEFVPDQPLAASTEYELVVTQGIRDADGMTLAAPAAVRFTTGAAAAASTFVLSRPFMCNCVSATGDSTAFVSLPRGSLSNATSVTLRNVRTGVVRLVGLLTEGGFDPVEVVARSGDVIAIAVQSSGDAPALSFQMTVPATSAPRVVRSSPSQHQQGVRLTASLFVVFSQPMDPMTREGEPWSPQLRRVAPSELVSGSFLVTGSTGYFTESIIFQPSAPLAPGTEYEMVTDLAALDAGGALAPFTLRFTTEIPPSGPPEALLAVSSFSMIEYQSAGWSYAPRLRVAEQGGRSGAQITAMRFSIDGLADPIPALCANVPVPRGETVDLFGELYGDYEVSFSGATRAAAGGEATATIVFRDDAGGTQTIVARTPVVPGGPPATYSGGIGHGYGIGGRC